MKKVIWLAAIAGLAQTVAQPPQPTFRTEANYVRVDAYPTLNGQPITDLTRDDFEIIEDKQPQKIEQFERVVVRAAGPQDTRIEPNTVAESRAMAESNPRARVFVLFLDTYHVDVAASRRLRRPLVEALDRMLGQDDLIAVMTPEMSARDIAFARKTTTIDGFLERYWHWGDRDRMIPQDPEDQLYGECFPNEVKPPPNSRAPDCTDQNGLAAEMIDRRHEKRSIDALRDLVRYLRGVREERKAILTISNGWLLFRPNMQMMRPLNCHANPTGPQVEVDPRSGRPTTKPLPTSINPSGTYNQCDIDRINLAQIDNEREFREILDEANRSNASFYPIDPRGLAAFDTPIMRMDVPGVPPPVLSPSTDRAMLTNRISSLQTLAENTDGLAIVNSNNLEAGFRRVVSDLTSYYLLGYYTTAKLDGKFHGITVRVKRPGVQVRARRGYLAPSPAELTRSTGGAGSDRAPTPAEAEALAFDAVLKPLSAFTRELPLRLRTVSSWKADGAPIVWLIGELGADDTWKVGAEADVTMMRESESVTTAHVSIPPGTRSFKVALQPASLAPGDYVINVRASAASQMATATDAAPFTLRKAPDASGSLLIRKGPFTGVREVPTADVRFRRSEQLRVELPAFGTDPPKARLLDRTGKFMSGVPMSAAVRDDADGSRWFTSQVPLFPLGPGDYVVEISSGSTKMLTPFRVVQ